MKVLIFYYMQMEASQEPPLKEVSAAFQYSEEVNMLHDAEVLPESNVSSLATHALLYTMSLREIAKIRAVDRALAQENPKYETQEWNKTWQFTQAHRETLSNDPDSISRIRSIRSLLDITNHVKVAFESEGATGLRPDQQTIRKSVHDFLCKEPELLAPNETYNRTFKPDIGLVVSPTGSGKTAVMAMALKDAGVGKTDDSGHRLRALVVEPTRQLVRQVAGVNKPGTFQQFAPDIKTTHYYAHHKDQSGDAVVITDASLIRGLADGSIDLKQFDILAVDEGHHLLAQNQLSLLIHPDLPPKVVVYTATPAYNSERDLQNRIKLLHKGSLIDYIEQGLLNSAQLFTFRVNVAKEMQPTIHLTYDEQSKLFAKSSFNHAVADGIQTLADKGKKIAVYCQRGSESLQARELAILLNARGIPTEPVGNFRKDEENTKALRKYDEGALQVLTTVDLLKEGWDAEVDAVVIAGRMYSKLRVEQIIGRGTRPSKDHPLTTYMEFLPILSEDQGKITSMWEVFGLNEVMQGKIFCPKQRRYPKKPSQDKGGPNEEPRHPLDSLFIEDFPEHLQELCRQVDRKLIRSITLGRLGSERRTPTPEDWVTLSTISEHTGTEAERIHGYLNKKGFDCIARWETSEQGQRCLTRYYPNDALEYLEQNPLPPLMSKNRITEKTLSLKHNISPHHLRVLATFAGFEHEPELLKSTSGRIPKYTYSQAAVGAILDQVEAIPWGEEGDIAIGKLAKEINCSPAFAYTYCEEHGIQPVFRRYKADIGSMIFRTYITGAEADRIRAAYHAIPESEESDVSYAEMAQRAGVGKSSVAIKAATPAEQALGVIKRNNHGNVRGRLTTMFPPEVAYKIIERIRRDELPPYLVKISHMTQIISLENRQALQQALEGQGWRPIALKLSKGVEHCYPWEALHYLEQRYGRRSGVAAIEYDNKVQSLHFASDSRIRLNPNDFFDAAAIAQKLGADRKDVDQAISLIYSHLAKYLRSAERRPDQSDKLTEHYTGVALQVINAALTGFTVSQLAQIVDMDVEPIEKFLQGHPTSKDGRFGFEALHYVQISFRRAPSTYSRLTEEIHRYNQDATDAAAFIKKYGGHAARFDDGTGARPIYISAFSKKLLEAQHWHKDETYAAPKNWFTRNELIEKTGCREEFFDRWLAQPHNLQSFNKSSQWCRRADGLVLPHLPPSLIRQFLLHLKNAHHK